MENCVLYLILSLISMEITTAFLPKYTKIWKNHPKYMINAGRKNCKMDLHILSYKLDRIENLLNKVLAIQSVDSESGNDPLHDQPRQDQSIPKDCKEKEIIKKEKEIIKKEKEIIKKEKEIKNKEKEIINKEKEIINKEKETINKEKEITNKEKEITNKGKEIINKENEIINKEKEFTNKGKEIINKGKEIKNKGKEIINKEKEIINKEKEIKNKGKEIINKEKEIKNKEKEITNKEKFKRESSKVINQQTEFIESKDASLEDIAQGIELLKEQVENMQINMETKINFLKRKTSKVLKNIAQLRPLLNLMNQKDENLTKAIANHMQNVQQYSENTKSICLNLLNKFEIPGKSCHTAQSRKQHTSCLDLFQSGFESSQVYEIVLDASESNEMIEVYCDMTTDLGGWTVFQRRQDGSENFFRDWNDYKTGFGNLTGEFWLGNEYLHKLTDTAEPHELRIELEDYEGNRAYAKYETFKTGPEKENYKLEVKGYTGNAGDSLEWHSGMGFSTYDRDNDAESSVSCAVWYKGGWWYNMCFASNLNGLYRETQTCADTAGSCILWKSWKDMSTLKILKITEMKFR